MPESIQDLMQALLVNPVNLALLIAVMAEIVALAILLRKRKKEEPTQTAPSSGNTIIYDKGSKTLDEDSVLLAEFSSSNYVRQMRRVILAVADGVGGAQKGYPKRS